MELRVLLGEEEEDEKSKKSSATGRTLNNSLPATEKRKVPPFFSR
jgi:hypothetical protein